MTYNRRKFLTFLGKAGIGAAVLPHAFLACNTATKNTKNNGTSAGGSFDFKGLKPSTDDELKLANGLRYRPIIKWNTLINDQDTFGYNNDFTCFLPLDSQNPKDGLLWVNHEYVNSLFVSGYDRHDKEQKRSIAQVDKEMYNVGGSIIRIQQNAAGHWNLVENDAFNRRITAKTPIEFNWDVPIKGAREAIGTLSNCSGGITPWNTFLSCEENYDNCFGETMYDQDNVPSHMPSSYGWEQFYDYPPEHYGWVVEIEPLTGSAQKHVALGRFAHECCTLVSLKDKRVVAYSGDDKNDEHLYKFIASKPESLKEGTLYVASLEKGQWLALDWDKHPVLQQRFDNQTEVLIRAREAAKLLGATPLNRPEDIEIDPVTGAIFVSLTNNKKRGDYHGSILKIEEAGGRYDALRFTSSTYKAGGEETGFSCPDNLAFDQVGNLWMTSDMSGSAMNKPDNAYTNFKNNSLFVIPRYGDRAGEVIRVANAPSDAELTGPWFAPDGDTLFLSVQHPGEQTTDLTAPTSLWPFDNDGIPKSAVVAIQGPLLGYLRALPTKESNS